MTYIRALMSLKFGLNRPRTTELAASEKLMFPFFLALYKSQVSIVALWATCLITFLSGMTDISPARAVGRDFSLAFRGLQD